MPRDSSGVYTLPPGNPVVTGTLIASTWANPTMSDIAAQLNNVLTRDGLLGPTGPFKLQDGTVAAPGLAFASEVGLGLYRAGTANLAMAAAGRKILGIDASNPLGATAVLAGNLALLPPDATNYSSAVDVYAKGTGNAILRGYSNLLAKWMISIPDPNGDFSVSRFDNAGAFVDSPLLITRANGKITFNNPAVTQTTVGAPIFTVEGTGTNGSSFITMAKPTGTGANIINGQVGGVNRWQMAIGDASAAFTINRYSVAGAFMDAAIAIPANTGDVQVARNFVAGVANGSAGFSGSAGFVVDGANQSVYMYGAGGGPAYRLGMAVSTGSTFLVTNGATRWTQTLGDTFVLGGANKGWQSGGGPWADTSDERIKEDIQPFNRGLEAILSLDPVTYRFKPETGRGDKRYTRLIAQQAMVGFPELVTVAPGECGDIQLEDMHALDEGPVLWALVNSTKELHARIAYLESQAAGA